MHLVFNHVAELKHVDYTNGCRLVEALACAAVVKVCLTIAWHSRLVGP